MYLLIAAAVAFLVGVISNEILRKNYVALLNDAENMDHTANQFLRRLKTKYENYFRAGREIKNTEAFTGKYLDRFTIHGINARSYEKTSSFAAGACVVIGICGAMLYPDNKMEYLLVGFLAMYVILGMRQMIDVKGKMHSITVNIVDYFENRYTAAASEERTEKLYENKNEKKPEIPLNSKDMTDEEREIIDEILNKFLS